MIPDDPRRTVTLAVAPAKLTRYLLDLASKDGHGKAKFFLAQGFTAGSLEEALLTHGASGMIVDVRRTRWGVVIEVTGPMPLPTGGTANILSAWQIDDDVPSVAKLLTAHLD